MLGFIYNILKFILVLVLPFAALIRGATFFHVEYGYNAMTCLLVSTIITSILLFVYFSFFYGKMTGRFGNFDAARRRALIAFLLVLVYAIHGVLFFSSSNTKSSSVEQEISSLHPILRLSLSTLVYLDNDLIITDASREPEDYKKMGLASKKSSLHYSQEKSGYVHAVDLRTNGRAEWRNQLISVYFRLLGFNTLRHIGTADHLHVSLLSHDRPHAK